jgi:hypothetical protein
MLFLQEFLLFQRGMLLNSNQNYDVHRKSPFDHSNQNATMHLLIHHPESDFHFVFLTNQLAEFYLEKDCDLGLG